MCLECRFLSVFVNRLLFPEDCSYRFECYIEVYVVTVAYAALYATAVVRPCLYRSVVVVEHVVYFASILCGCIKTDAELNAFYGIYAEHGVCQLCVELVEFRFTDAGRASFYHACYDAANGVSLLFGFRY